VTAGDRPTLLLVLGISIRSGTNFLNGLLRCHDDIGQREPLWEDYIFEKIEPLLDFATDVVSSWQQEWVIADEEPRRFVTLLGDAIEKFFVDGFSSQYVLSRTPSSHNVYAVPLLLPRSPILFIARDGRSVCESAYLTFGDDREETARVWARNGREILDFLAQSRLDHPPYILLRYEDLVADPVGPMLDVLDALGLDRSGFDTEKAHNLPVKGSSVWRGGRSEVHWDPIPRGEEFRPLERHQHWDAEMNKWFMEIAGDVQEAFGYPTAP
jgi:Sulfotransferase family